MSFIEISLNLYLQLDEIKKKVAEMSGRGVEDVRVVVSPYRICPLGAHIDHQVSLSCLSVPDCQISCMGVLDHQTSIY